MEASSQSPTSKTANSATPSQPVASPQTSPQVHFNQQRPSLAAQALYLDNELGRRPSIQFAPDSSKDGVPLGRIRTGSSARKMSPPPKPKFEARVGFDTFDKKNETVGTAYTLARKHADYHFTRESRTFLCGLDDNDYSGFALEWLIDELVDDGDEVVCLRIIDKDSSIAGTNSIETGKYKQEAEQVMEAIVVKNHENKAINLILEFAIGKVEKVIMRMIKVYEPAILIVGTRGRSLGGIQGLLPGSVSKYCLQNSPVPVIVVRPNSQRSRGKRKRQKDPSRQLYRDLLDKSDKHSQREDVLDRINVVLERGSPISDDEAAQVAKALGMGSTIQKERLASSSGRGSPGSPLVKVQTVDDDVDSEEEKVDLNAESSSENKAESNATATDISAAAITPAGVSAGERIGEGSTGGAG